MHILCTLYIAPYIRYVSHCRHKVKSTCEMYIHMYAMIGM